MNLPFALGLGLAALGPALLAGCAPAPPETTPTTTATCHFDLTLGRVSESGFIPFADGDEAGVVLGFQGFRFIDAAAVLDGPSATDAAFRVRATADGHEPVTSDAHASLTPMENGESMAEHVQIFFNDIPMAELLGRTCKLEVRATVAGCTGEDDVSVVLGDGGCMPSDAGAPDSGIPDGGGDPCADAGL